MKLFLFAVLLTLSLTCSARSSDPSNSLYQLDVRLTDQRDRVHGLDVYRGHPVLITMFYGSCTASCPLIIDALRATERALTVEQRADLRVLLVSFDSTNDSPKRLREIAEERQIDGERWTLAHTDEVTVRQIAAVLDVQYRRLPNGQYNHSNVIVALSPAGEILARSNSLRPDAAVLKALADSAKSAPPVQKISR